jgi:hypothetical protein
MAFTTIFFSSSVIGFAMRFLTCESKLRLSNQTDTSKKLSRVVRTASMSCMA